MAPAKFKQVAPRRLWHEEDKDFTPGLSSKEALAGPHSLKMVQT